MVISKYARHPFVVPYTRHPHMITGLRSSVNGLAAILKKLSSVNRSLLQNFISWNVVFGFSCVAASFSFSLAVSKPLWSRWWS